MDCLVRGVTKSWTQLSDFRVMMSAGGMQSTLLLLLTSVFALGSSKVAVGFFWSFSMFCPEFTLTVHTHSYFYSHWVSLWA